MQIAIGTGAATYATATRASHGPDALNIGTHIYWCWSTIARNLCSLVRLRPPLLRSSSRRGGLGGGLLLLLGGKRRVQPRGRLGRRLRCCWSYTTGEICLVGPGGIRDRYNSNAGPKRTATLSAHAAGKTSSCYAGNSPQPQYAQCHTERAPEGLAAAWAVSCTAGVVAFAAVALAGRTHVDAVATLRRYGAPPCGAASFVGACDPAWPCAPFCGASPPLIAAWAELCCARPLADALCASSGRAAGVFGAPFAGGLGGGASGWVPARAAACDFSAAATLLCDGIGRVWPGAPG